MPNITNADLASVMNLTVGSTGDITATQLEQVIDLAIDALNLYNANIPNMTGTAGTKSVSLGSKQKGAVFLVARLVYYSFFKDLDKASLNSLTIDTVDLLSNPENRAQIKEAAEQLRSDVPAEMTAFDVRIG